MIVIYHTFIVVVIVVAFTQLLMTLFIILLVNKISLKTTTMRISLVCPQKKAENTFVLSLSSLLEALKNIITL